MTDFTAKAIEEAKAKNLRLVRLIITERCGPGTEIPRIRVELSGLLNSELENSLSDFVTAWIRKVTDERTT